MFAHWVERDGHGRTHIPWRNVAVADMGVRVHRLVTSNDDVVDAAPVTTRACGVDQVCVGVSAAVGPSMKGRPVKDGDAKQCT